MPIIYGVDTEKPFTLINVRDAIVECFVNAHTEVLAKAYKEISKGMKEGDLKKLQELNVVMLIQRYFTEVGGDFNEPTKESIIAVCNKLAEFAKKFRGEEIIKKHYGEIMQLINGLK